MSNMLPQLTSSLAGQSSQKQHELPRTRKFRPQPEHYIRRTSGELVPLVPVDELPLEFHGLPRSLGSIENRRMVFLGEKGPVVGYYKLRQPNLLELSKLHSVQSSPASYSQSPKTVRNHRVFEDFLEPRSSSEETTSNSTVATSADTIISQVRPQLASLNLQSELCHNWIRGYCKYEPNCNRIHQLPETSEELQIILSPGKLYRGLSKSLPGLKDQTQTTATGQNAQLSHPRQAARDQLQLRKEIEGCIARFQGSPSRKYLYVNHGAPHRVRPQAQRASASVIESQLRRKVTVEKSLNQHLSPKTESEREQHEVYTSAAAKGREERNGTQTTLGNKLAGNDQHLACTTGAVKTGNLVDVK